jgi:nitroreductase
MGREADFPVDPLFTNRWSPRSFTGEEVPLEVLHSALEAARWAPSASNAQPWRFLIARNGDASWGKFTALLNGRNARWANRASALVLIVSALEVERGGERVPNNSHSFDAGAAWANFAHQALLLGWHTHGIGGYDRDLARETLKVPDTFALEALIALGRQGEIDTLDEDFHAQESPNARRPLAESVFAGEFGAPAFERETA